MNIKLIFFSFFYLVVSSSVAASQDFIGSNNRSSKGILNATFENDLFAGTDLGYTNGVRISYVTPEEQMPNLIRNISNNIPLLNKEGKKYIALAAGQKIYTPTDIASTSFIPNDFLYAGWLYGSIGVMSDAGTVYDSSIITIGTIGPSSRAKEAQRFVHKVRGIQKPEGWNNQLKDEVGIIFSYERKWREVYAAEKLGLGFDVIPHVGVNLGNIHTDATIGATFRFGYDLPADYGPTKIHPSMAGSDIFIPSKNISAYVFSIVEMSAVGRNIFLDGNTFKDSPSLEKRNFVKNIQLGVALAYKDSRLSYTQVFATRSFKGQKDRITEFGSLTYSYNF